MICNKCNHRLPDDSEFCQYCGNKIATAVVSTTELVGEEGEKTTAVGAAASVSSNEALDTILQIQAKNTVEAMGANSKSQPDNEGDADFGLVPEKPIFTLALDSVDGEIEYLDKLHTVNGEKIKYNRRGSMSVNGINGMIDIYDTYLLSGQPYKTIYINMYGAKRSTKVPEGFVLEKAAVHPASASMPSKGETVDAPVLQNKKSVKSKYCSKCGSVIDNKTKKCTGCGKQYFRGLRLTKFSVTVITLALAFAVVSTLYVVQYVNNQAAVAQLENEVDGLEKLVAIRDSTISRLETDIDILEKANWSNRDKLNFFNNHAVIVDEHSRKYHKYECDDLDLSYFWIYNTEKAEQLGYYACSKCH